MPAGKLRANCCILEDGERNAVVADPGGDFRILAGFLDDRELTVRAILLTHGHDDHTGALRELKEYTGAPVYIHEADAYRLGIPADVLLKDGDEISAGTMHFRVIHVPGHTEGSVLYLTDGLMLSGDTLFSGGIGRTDLPGGSSAEMEKTLEKIRNMELPGVTVVPGHGQFTTLERETEFNPFL